MTFVQGLNDLYIHLQTPQFTLVMKKRGKRRKPAKSRVNCLITLGSKKKVRKQIDSQTRYRLYRGDLKQLAVKRIWQIQKIRSKYRKGLKKERMKNRRRNQKNSNSDGNGNQKIADDMLDDDDDADAIAVD